MKSLIEHGMLFKPEMVVGIQYLIKKETRRGLKTEPKLPEGVWTLYGAAWRVNSEMYLEFNVFPMDGDTWFNTGIKSRYGRPGDWLAVRETFYAYGIWEFTDEGWTFHDKTKLYGYNYKYLDSPPRKIKSKRGNGIGWYKRPSLFMPSNASRLHMKIEHIAIERLHDITETAAMYEGIGRDRSPDGEWLFKNYEQSNRAADIFENITPRQSYFTLWDSINGKGSAKKNPWVIRVVFDYPIEKRVMHTVNQEGAFQTNSQLKTTHNEPV